MEKVDIANLKQMVNTEGWKVLKEELSAEIKSIENVIFSIDDGKNNDVKYSENDLLKRLRLIYTTLLVTPEETIESWETEEELNEEGKEIEL